MLIELKNEEQSMTSENFNKFFDLIQKGNAFTGIPIEFIDRTGVIDLEKVRYCINEIRKIDRTGYLSIIILLDSKFSYDNDFSNNITDLCQSYHNVYIKIKIEEGFNIENIRPVIENPLNSSKLIFEYLITDEVFDLNKYIGVLFKYTLNNIIVLSLDNTKKYNYEKITDSIINSNKYRRKKTVALEFSCGFPSCMFSNEQLGDLFRTPMVSIHFFCRPKVVVKPNLDIYYCENPNSFSLNINQIKSIKDLYEQMDLIKEQRESYIYDECDGCWFNEKMCSGGCYLN